MKKLLCAFLLIGMSSVTVPSFAQSATPTPAPAKKKHKKVIKKKAVPAKTDDTAVDGDADDPGELKIGGGTLVTNFNCELGDKITTYYNDDDANHIAIRWKDKLHRMRRVGTTTGANRFENHQYGLVWINIPSKAMLLDSKKGQQLANECRSPDQVKSQASVQAAKG